VVAVAVLAAVALVAADGVGWWALNNRLIEKIDQQLDRQRRNFPPPDQFDPRDRPVVSGPAFRIYRFGPTGNLLLPTALKGTKLDPDPGNLNALRAHADKGTPFTMSSPSGSWRMRVVWDDEAHNIGGFWVAAVSLSDVQDTEDNLLIIDVAVIGVVLLLLGAAVATVVQVGLRPLTRMEETASEIAGGGDLSRRVTDADPHTESGRLGTALNTMLSRVESAVEDSIESERRLRQFLADAAHELRTPVTSIQGFAELYRRGGAPPGPALNEAMTCIEAETGRMRLLINDLLTLARLDEERPLQRSHVDLLSVAADSVRDAHVRVPTRFVQLSGLDEYSATFEPVSVFGDEQRIRQVANNLVGNALQHTTEETRVVVRVGRPTSDTGNPPTVSLGAELPPDQPVAAIEVSDTGPGMAIPDAQRVFERLYRADSSRTRRNGAGGAGLGLAIVAAIVQAHGGRVELWTSPGKGARFRVLLPAEPPVPDDFDDPEILDNP
jgi:two-component system OmpR family sensor kinase